MNGHRITLSIDAESGAHKSPDRIRLGELIRFTEDVKTLLHGDGKEIDANEVEVSVVKGSYAYETLPLPASPRLFADLQALASGDLTGIDEKRKAIIEKWQKLAKGAGKYIFKVSAPFLNNTIVVNEKSHYRLVQLEQWVNVERYLEGEVQDLGGSNKSNVHVKMPDGKVLKVQADKKILKDDHVNRVYKKAIIRVNAEFNINTREIRNAKLIEFVEHSFEPDEEAIRRMKEKGAVAWRGVKSASAWVDKLRGNEN